MDAVILHNPVWEYKRGLVVKEEKHFVTVRIIDKYNKGFVYDLRLPWTMVKLQPTVGEA